MFQKCLSKQRPWRGSRNVYKHSSQEVLVHSVSQQTAKPRSLQISTQLLLTPRHQRCSPSPERQRLLSTTHGHYAWEPDGEQHSALGTHLRSCTPPAAGWCWTCPLGSEGHWGHCEHSRFWDWSEGSRSLPLTSWRSCSGTDWTTETVEEKGEMQQGRKAQRGSASAHAAAVASASQSARSLLVPWRPAWIRLWILFMPIYLFHSKVTISKMTSSLWEKENIQFGVKHSVKLLNVSGQHSAGR